MQISDVHREGRSPPAAEGASAGMRGTTVNTFLDVGSAVQRQSNQTQDKPVLCLLFDTNIQMFSEAQNLKSHFLCKLAKQISVILEIDHNFNTKMQYYCVY